MRFFLLSVLATISLLGNAHPVPDIPVRSYFTHDGSCTVHVEVDPRCFSADPNTATSLLKPIFETLTEERKAELRSKAADLVKRYVEFYFEPGQLIAPAFSFDFTGHDRAPLVADDDIVVLTGSWQTQVPQGAAQWRIRATKETPLAIVFRNYLETVENPKFSVLFPGETSFPFELNKAPEPLKHIVFGSCLNVTDHPMLNQTLSLPMDLFLFMGDNIYADTTDMAIMRAKYAALSQSTFFQGLRTRAPILATWDDHDMGLNDGGSEYPMLKQSQKEFLDWLNEPAGSKLRKQEGIYHSRSYGPDGKRTQVIMLDTRYFRSPLKKVSDDQKKVGGSTVPTDDVNTTILGASQWFWLAGELKKPAELRLIVTSIQFAAEACGSESWANFPHEQKRLVELIRSTAAKGVVFLSGDRHWSEISALRNDAAYPLYDVTSSSMTQTHERGTPTQNKNRIDSKTYHQPNVGTLDVDWTQPDVSLTFLIRDVHSAPQIERTIRLSELK